MKLLLICSRAFYPQIPPVRAQLEAMGHTVELPNSYFDPLIEEKSWEEGPEAHSAFKARMFRMSEERIARMDGVLTLNLEKNGVPGYIGGATFLELYEAFRGKKRIFLLYPIPKGILYDEISGFSPVILNGDLTKIR